MSRPLAILTCFLLSCDGNRQLDGGLLIDLGPPPQDGEVRSPDGDADLDEDREPGEPVCRELELPVVRVVPDLLIILDRSNSMASADHWDPVRDALVELTASMDRRIAFGLMVFPAHEGSLACSFISNGCQAPEGPSIDCRRGNGSSIRRELLELSPCGGTPTAPSLFAAADYFLDFESPTRVPSATSSGSYVLLATDGAPNCNDELLGDFCRCTAPVGCVEYPLNCLDDGRTYQAIELLSRTGVSLFVLGILVSEWREVLDEMARLGGTGTAFMAERHEEILRTLDEITSGLTTCEVAFRDPGPVADPELVNFYLDGVLVPRAEAEGCETGWEWADESRRRVRFCGSFCSTLRDGDVDEVRATFGCPSLY